MQIDRSNAARRFSSAADTYDKAVSVQPTVAETLFSLIPAHLAPQRVLEIGCGTGLLTGYLAEFFKCARLDAVDASDRMISQAEQKLTDCELVSFHHTPFLSFTSDSPYDLVVSSSALHWMIPFEQAASKVHNLLIPGGLLAAAVMLNGTLQELHATRSRIAPRKLPAAVLPTQSQLADTLETAGFEITFFDEQIYNVRYSSSDTLLASLNRAGVTGGAFSRGTLPLTRGELEALKTHYSHEYGADDGSIPATYHVGYVLAGRCTET